MSDDAGAIGHDRLMDRVYARQRHIYDATRKYYLLGRDELIADLDPPADAHVLEIGCGTGRNLIKIARRYPQVRLYGVDISQEMLTTAAASVARAGLASRITLAQGDATSCDPKALFGVGKFERVVISYALSMIPPWREVLRHAAGLLAPGGELHIVDFGDQARLPAAFKRLLAGWLARFHVTPRETLPAEIDAVGAALGRQVVCRPIFRGYAILARLSA
ncbi:Methyltransferase [Beijerinckiaceae bacterium RH AL1]|nr:Methyltransferase [Beijerinckiaceae bacterium RH CH11]VVB47385.1 Methyltransferase [Beijerinckiaceae bacterium RH AL8]VVC55817.1 Methyltransferase [Beijerinckiaceae bacterium RH AL1]